MAELARVPLVPVGGNYASASAGQAAGWVDPNGGGDVYPIGEGHGSILRFKTGGTGSTVTINSLKPSNYGTDVNIVLTLSSTDEQEVFIPNDRSNRFDSVDVPGKVSITYSSVTTMKVAAKIVP